MTAIALLPPELLMHCLSFLGVGRAHYNDRERQHALVLVSRVSRAWAQAANSLLFASPSAQNTGRASLLDEVLTRRSDYAEMAQRFAWTAKNGLVDGNLLNSCLTKMVNLERLEIGAQLLQSPHIVDCISKTVQKLPIKSFICGSSWISPLEHVVALLPGLPRLRELRLHNFFDVYATDAITLQESDGPKPTYDLDTLSIAAVDQLSPARLAWLLGHTRSLRTLKLGISTKISRSAADQVVDVLKPFFGTLRCLEITVDVKMARDAEGRHGVYIAQLVLPHLLNIERLTIGGHHGLDIPCLNNRHLLAVRSLTLLDPWLAGIAGNALLAGRLPSLSDLRVVNLSKVGEAAKLLHWQAEARDVKLTLERRFG